MRTKKVKDPAGNEVEVMDRDSMPPETLSQVGEYGPDARSMDIGSLTGLSLGAIKQLAEHLEECDLRLEHLERRLGT